MRGHPQRPTYLHHDPRPCVPERQSKKGRQAVKLQAQSEGVRVNQWILQQSEDKWQRISLRDSTKGKLIVDIIHERVWLWDSQEAVARQWHLIVRREIGSKGTLKYSLSNTPSETSTKELAYMQSQRYWIERAFQDSKTWCGIVRLPSSRLSGLAQSHGNGDAYHALSVGVATLS